MAGPGNPSCTARDIRVQYARPSNPCGCDESRSLYKSIEELAAVGTLLQLEKERLIDERIDCERKLAKMTQERDDLKERLLQAAGRKQK